MLQPQNNIFSGVEMNERAAILMRKWGKYCPRVDRFVVEIVHEKDSQCKQVHLATGSEIFSNCSMHKQDLGNWFMDCHVQCCYDLLVY